MGIRNLSKKKGVTMIEILIVLAIVAVLASVTIVALNPRKRFAESRDTRREGDAIQLLGKIHQYFADGHSLDDLETSAGLLGVCGTSDSSIGSSDFNLGTVLVDSYLTVLPVDPEDGCDSADTCYDICKHDVGNRITIKAPNAETRVIEETR